MRSNVGNGSVFSVLVPLTDPAQLCAPPRAGRRSSYAGGRPGAGAGDRQRARHAGRHDPAAAHLGLPRRRRGRTRPRRSPRIGAEGFRPDILLADYHLDAGQRGTEVITALRHALDEEIPAVVITADRSAEVQSMVQALSGVTLLTKPIKPARLRALIASARR